MAAKPKKASTPKKVTTTTTTVTNAKHVTTKKTVTTTTGGSTSSGNRATTAKKTTSTAKFAAVSLATRYITGPGDERPLCSVIAVANSLLASVGAEAANADLERLYRAAGGHGDSGAHVPAVLAAVASDGLAGCRLASWRPASHPSPGGVLLLELDITPDLHAVASLGGGTVATWGDAVPLTALQARICAAWDLSWHGEEAACR